MDMISCLCFNGTNGQKYTTEDEKYPYSTPSRLNSYSESKKPCNESVDPNASPDESNHIEQQNHRFSHIFCSNQPKLTSKNLKRPLHQQENIRNDNLPIPWDSVKNKQWDDYARPKKPAEKSTVLHVLIQSEKWEAVRASLQRSEVKPVLSMYDENLCTPLIIACKRNAPRDIIKLLLFHDPNTCIMSDGDGNFPLHYICKYGVDVDVLQDLLDCHPEAASRRNRKMRSPLQIVLERQMVSSEWIARLVCANPGAASLCDKNGDLPLHYCGKIPLDVQSLQLLIDAYPIAIRKLNRYDAPPILLAASRGAPYDILETLLRANPAMVSVDDKRGLCSILALWNQHMQRRKVDPRLSEKERRRVASNRHAIQKITQMKDLRGKHEELWKKLELLLYTAISSSGDVSSSQRNWKALHAVVAYGCPPEMVQLALNLFKDQVNEVDEYGKIPLHHAAEAPSYISQPSDEKPLVSSIDLVMNSHIEGIKAMDLSGRIPLHCALENGNSWELGVNRLVEKDPTTLNIPAEKSGLYPFMISAASKSPTTIEKKRKRLKQSLKARHKDWKSMTSVARERLIEEDEALDDLASLNTTFLLLRKAPLAVKAGLKCAPDDEEAKKLRSVNMVLWREKRKLRKELYALYKEIDHIDTDYEAQKASLHNEIDKLGLDSSSYIRKKRSMQRENSSNVCSVLRDKNSLEVVRNKYMKGRVKFMPNLVEYNPSDIEQRDEGDDKLTENDEMKRDDFLDDWFDENLMSEESSNMSLGTNLLKEDSKPNSSK